MTCPYCRSALKPGLKFCTGCGNAVSTGSKAGCSGVALAVAAAGILLLVIASAAGLWIFREYLNHNTDVPAREKPLEPPPESEVRPDPVVEPEKNPLSPPSQQPQPGLSQRKSDLPIEKPPSPRRPANPATEYEDSEPLHITANVQQPILIHKVEPVYPEIAQKARIQGVVILEAVVTKTGDMEDVRVLRSLHPILDQSAVHAVSQWRYQPARLEGKPVKVYFTVTVKFTLR